ncbi:metallophosphoesterase family protein [Pontiellaceae bacterium B12227]|nr:metallophosphoesterase family protein [Pontiellaceae bacterium B12227]
MKSMVLAAICIVPLLSFGRAEFYRVAWRDDPSTSAVVCWNQVSGENPEVCFGPVDHGMKAIAYENRAEPTRTLDYRGMNNHFVRLENLKPDTAYYFVICDSEGVGRRLWFKTAPDRPQPFTFISGGDSRTNPEPRREGNKLVAKLRPLFVLFGGDYSGSGTAEQWKEWFSDWQLTISEDGRIFPIIATHGNHENADMQMMEHLFDTPHPDQYYSMGIGGDMMRIWVLNSELEYKDKDKVDEQNAWIRSDLPKYADAEWKVVAYHRPMRAHTSRKAEGLNRIKWWSQLFYDQGVDLVIESDTHMTKRTYPVRPSEEEGSYESFIRDDEKGFVFLGEGSWGAPARPANDDKPWTMASESFHQYKWIQVYPEELLIRTVQFDGADKVKSLAEADLFAEPEGMKFWVPESGKVLRLPFDSTHPSYTKPSKARMAVEREAEWQWSLDGNVWAAGRAPLGYGDDVISTAVCSEGERPLSARFLKEFDVKDAGKVKRLFFDVRVDDGCLVKLNGVEVVRHNLPEGEISERTLAVKTVSLKAEGRYLPFPVDTARLKNGVNRIEVQVFQQSSKSSDLIFDMAVRIKE